MVHRIADSRLLTNLLSQDKEYSKQFSSLLDAAHASVSLLSAYAAASTPPAGNAMLKVAGSLASADDALRRYASSIEEWRERLKGLKTLEDEVSNIIRDREILVTRVIKASKSQKPSSNGGHYAMRYPSSSSLGSIKSEFSGKSVAGTSKLAHAQSELQACEAHLAAKERELAIQRIAIVKTGLDVRFREMVNCGWAWGEIGKEALRTLEQLSSTGDQCATKSTTMGHSASASNVNASRPSSDLSSIGPSQSASQINLALLLPPAIPPANPTTGILSASVSEPATPGQPLRSQSPSLAVSSRSADPLHTTMKIPPAHAISELGLPIATKSVLPSPPVSNLGHDRPLAPVYHRTASLISVKSLPIVQDEAGPSADHNEYALGVPYGNGLGPGDAPYRLKRHILSRRITEEEPDSVQRHSQDANGPSEHPYTRDEEPGGSSEDESQQHAAKNVTVVENPRFRKSKAASSPSGKLEKREYHEVGKSALVPSGKRERRGSVFGSLRGLFGHSKNASVDSSRGLSTATPGRGSGGGGGLTGLFGGGKKHKWDTRTEKNVKALQKRDKSDSEDDRRDPVPSIVGLNSPPRVRARTASEAGVSGRSSRGSLRFVDAVAARERAASPALASDSGGSIRRDLRGGISPRIRRKRSSSVPGRTVTPVMSSISGEEGNTKGKSVTSRLDEGQMSPRRTKSPPPGQIEGPPTERATLSRNPSLMSSASAPVTLGGVRTKKPAGTGAQVGRRVSLRSNVSSLPGSSNEGKEKESREKASGHARSASHPTTSVSLMSIVEDVARANREAEGRLAVKESLPLVGLYKSSAPASQSKTSLSPPPTFSSPGSTALQGRKRSFSRGSTHSGESRLANPEEALIMIPRAPPSVGRKELEAMEMEEQRKAEMEREEKMRVPRAPGSVFDVLARQESGSRVDGVGSGIRSLKRGSALSLAREGAQSPQRMGTESGARQGRAPDVKVAGSPASATVAATRRPVKSPLRSALRNPRGRSRSTSRVGSPAPVSDSKAAASGASANASNKEMGQRTGSAPPSTPSKLVAASAPPRINLETSKGSQDRGRTREERKEEEDDGASVSSYETGHEVFDEEKPSNGDSRLPESIGRTPTASVSGLDAPPANGQREEMVNETIQTPPLGSDSSTISVGDQVGGVPQRRKSVRVSLRPTFSPPVVYNDEEEQEENRSADFSPKAVASRQRRPERVNGWVIRRPLGEDVEDMWENSSEEDEEYASAKRLLSSVAREKEGKGW
ncbi:hypothetical protein AX17_005390 [Amanita inopinata Kibby_2008]|nr:hypothetical protein AX17_005390 [Amanita inopinata Kibby_2008]